MREVRGLVDSLVAYVKNALQEDIANDKVPPLSRPSPPPVLHRGPWPSLGSPSPP